MADDLRGLLLLRYVGPERQSQGLEAARKPQVDPVGFEPTTFSLQASCSTNWSYGPRVGARSFELLPVERDRGLAARLSVRLHAP